MSLPPKNQLIIILEESYILGPLETAGFGLSFWPTARIIEETISLDGRRKKQGVDMQFNGRSPTQNRMRECWGNVQGEVELSQS